MTQEAKERRQRAEAETAAAGGVLLDPGQADIEKVGKVWGKIQSRRNENRV